MMLRVGVDNARYNLERSLADYAAGTLTAAHHPHALAAAFRQMGVCRLLSEGVVEPLFIAQMQAASGYLYRLPLMPEDDKVTSRAAVFWDAVGGEYWDAAAAIVRHSRAKPNLAWEHEDDFLYVWFLMIRYFPELSADASTGEQRQRALLDRWEVVLEGGHDARLLLCDALLRGDSMGFREAFEEVSDARTTELREQVDEQRLSEADAAWVLPFWGEGLALLRLAARDGLSTDEHCEMVPQVTRATNPFAYDAGAWRQIDFKPRRR